MLEIKILGIGCQRYKAMKANVLEAVRKSGVAVRLIEVTDLNTLMELGIGATPALMVDGEIIFEDYVPTLTEILGILENHKTGKSEILPKKWLLVPVDFSEVATNSFHFAMSLAPVLDASIQLVHVVHPDFDPTNPYFIPPIAEIQATHQKRLENFVIAQTAEHEDTGGIAQAVKIECQTLIGFPVQEIIRVASELQPFMVVMGMTGETGLVEKLFGSVSAGVSQQANWPVLLVPQRATFKHFKEIVYASSFMKGDESVMNRILDLGKMFHATIHIVHVVGSKENGVEADEPYFATAFHLAGEKGAFTFETIENASVAEGLNRYMAHHDADLLVMMTRHRSFWQNLMHKSITRRMALLSSKPLLIIHFDF